MRFFGLILSLLVLSSSCGIVFKSELQESTSALEESQAALGEELATAKERMDELEARLDALEHRMQVIDENVATLRTGATEDLTGLREAMQGTVSSLRESIESMQKTLEAEIEAEKSARRDETQDLLRRYSVLLEEVTKENEEILKRIEALETGLGSASVVHVVRRGETLSKIAARYGVSVESIVRTNGLANPNRISVGQKLLIPGGSD